jgi:hypothetical protein
MSKIGMLLESAPRPLALKTSEADSTSPSNPGRTLFSRGFADPLHSSVAIHHGFMTMTGDGPEDWAVTSGPASLPKVLDFPWGFPLPGKRKARSIATPFGVFNLRLPVIRPGRDFNFHFSLGNSRLVFAKPQ